MSEKQNTKFQKPLNLDRLTLFGLVRTLSTSSDVRMRNIQKQLSQVLLYFVQRKALAVSHFYFFWLSDIAENSKFMYPLIR